MTAGAVSAPLIIPIIPLQTHRTKNHIDTNTPVSIQSAVCSVSADTPDVVIFYTVDGSRPASGQAGSGVSRKYSEPVLLPAGRVSVRAVAVCRDGRRSSMVTKVFCVDLVDAVNRKENIENFTQVVNPPKFQHPTKGTSCSAGSSPRTSEQRMMGNRPPSSGPVLGSGAITVQKSESSGVLKQVSRTETSQIHQETNLLRCAQCLSVHPSDPFARFCSQCGAEIPPLPERPPPAEGGQDHGLCVSCGCVNPVRVTHCLSCEGRLLQVCVGNDLAPVPSADIRKFSCSSCKRLNRVDARYCDWCGCKAANCILCWRCGASGCLFAFYCTECGVNLEATATPAPCSDITQSVRGASPKKPSSDPTPRVKVIPLTADQYTQTVGLYYPSATELHKKQMKLQLSRKQATGDRRPLLTAISPGGGFWRKQLDHVCAHLRSYAQNNAPFRTLLGEPRLGRMLSAVIQDDGSEVGLTVSFVLVSQKEKQVSPERDEPGPAGLMETLSSVMERRADSSSLRRVAFTDMMKPPKPAGRSCTNIAQVTEAQLLKELRPGRGQITVIQQLLDQGADPSCCGSDGRHALAVAVVNGHCDALPVLVQRGADVEQQSGPMKNTALHEAAALGVEGLRSAEVLLSCKASVKRRNTAGQTPYDVALSSGCDIMVSLLAARTGLDLLGHLGKPKLNLDLS
ncbi:double zinc ribbon and ankyrin repeat-containing protein 1 isoform X2 [Echeneis naucrates]|uniref:double zinc ribbon and ankyrin repeat-containing protein 1 isoform X2 n=1 Tax=Echeneis naucrates TaxID=173247 RepID=UPI001113F7D2|nr:double zinc ribbon and ankyrin repeat-containing protein 1 isoform X2 [Echeneis naucrates]